MKYKLNIFREILKFRVNEMSDVTARRVNDDLSACLLQAGQQDGRNLIF